MNKNKFFWYLIGIGSFIILNLIILGNIVLLGEKIRNVSEIAEITFYVLSALIVYFLVINPIRIIVLSPSLQINTVFDNKKNIKTSKKVAKNLVKTNKLQIESIEKLKEGIKNTSIINENLNFVYNNEIKKKINNIIINNAKTVMTSTAISQNGKLDMFTVIAVNLRMIKQIVCECGFRPSYKNLAKLSVNVLGTSLIAEGLENLNLNEVIPTNNILGEIPFIKPIMSSIMQGVSNALLTLRIGIITSAYLFGEEYSKDKKQMRKYALKEALKMLPLIIKDTINIVPEGFKKIFNKQNSKIKSDLEA